MEHWTADTPVAECAWDDLEAVLSDGSPGPVRVLLATDGSEAAGAAEQFLALLPLPAGSAVQVLTVLDAVSWQVPESLRGAEQEWASRIARTTEAKLSSRGTLRLSHSIVRGAPAQEIIRAADAFNADLIVVGSHGRTGLERCLVGSVAENVAKHARRPVLVARAPEHGLRRVVLAIDSSEHAQRTIRLAGHLPLPADTRVTVCHVVRPYCPAIGSEYVPKIDEIVIDVQKQQEKEATILAEAAAGRLQRWGKQVDTAVRVGDPATEILLLARELKADLVIAGARGLSPIQTLFFGSVADRLLKSAGRSVLLVH